MSTTTPPPSGSYRGPAMPSVPGPEGGQPFAPTRPRTIDVAVNLMYAGATLSVISGFASLAQDRDSLRSAIEDSLTTSGQEVTQGAVDAAVVFALGIGIVVGFIFAGIWVLMALYNGRGASWARIVATVLGGLNLLVLLTALVSATALGSSGGPISLILAVTTMALAAGILVLLWKPESNAYYAAVSARREVSPGR